MLSRLLVADTHRLRETSIDNSRKIEIRRSSQVIAADCMRICLRILPIACLIACLAAEASSLATKVMPLVATHHHPQHHLPRAEARRKLPPWPRGRPGDVRRIATFILPGSAPGPPRGYYPSDVVVKTHATSLPFFVGVRLLTQPDPLKKGRKVPMNVTPAQKYTGCAALHFEKFPTL